MNTADSIVNLLQQLTRIPSRAGVDNYDPIAKFTLNWLRERKVACETLDVDGRPVGLYAVIESASESTNGPVYMLNATLDTAGFGEESRWERSPTSGTIHNGWLFGRGSADSKAGVSLFCHLAVELAAVRDEWRGKCVLLLDLDEHTGAFTGVHRYFGCGSDLPMPNGVFIGYPGNERIVVGSRGFLRAVVSVHGIAAHSGSSNRKGVNAILRTADLAQRLSALNPLCDPIDAANLFPLPPQITVTGIESDQSFAMVPDACRLWIDVRLTPQFSESEAKATVQRVVDVMDRRESNCPPTVIDWRSGWPAYRVNDNHPMVSAIQRAAEQEFHRRVPLEVVGPSNIGNYLSTLGIPAVSGFGVTYRGIHALNEAVELNSLGPTFRAYRTALRSLLVPH